MTEPLKTLEDLNGYDGNRQEVDEMQVCKHELRQEAIKWVKTLKTTISSDLVENLQELTKDVEGFEKWKDDDFAFEKASLFNVWLIRWIVRFFNLTEEDLKDE